MQKMELILTIDVHFVDLTHIMPKHVRKRGKVGHHSILEDQQILLGGAGPGQNHHVKEKIW